MVEFIFKIDKFGKIWPFYFKQKWFKTRIETNIAGNEYINDGLKWSTLAKFGQNRKRRKVGFVFTLLSIRVSYFKVVHKVFSDFMTSFKDEYKQKDQLMEVFYSQYSQT